MMREFRCSHCGSLLFKAEFIGRVEIKCQRGKCGAFNTFIVEPPRAETERSAVVEKAPVAQGA